MPGKSFCGQVLFWVRVSIVQQFQQFKDRATHFKGIQRDSKSFKSFKSTFQHRVSKSLSVCDQPSAHGRQSWNFKLELHGGSSLSAVSTVSRDGNTFQDCFKRQKEFQESQEQVSRGICQARLNTSLLDVTAQFFSVFTKSQ